MINLLPVKDLALIKINNPRTALRPINISRKVPAIGSRVHAIGHPDLEVWSYTTGYISQIRDEYEWSYEDEFKHMANVYYFLINKYALLILIMFFLQLYQVSFKFLSLYKLSLLNT